MKKLLIYIALVLVLSACAGIPGIQSPLGDSNIQIGVYVAGGGAVTKGSVTQITDGSPGEGTYGENYLKTLDFFFYLEGSGDDDGVDYNNQPLPSPKPIYHIHKDNVNANTTWTLGELANRTVLDAIFASSDRCVVYVIANYTPSTPFATQFADQNNYNLKRIALRQLVAESVFNKVSTNGEDGEPQSCFVMEGSTEIQRTLKSGYYYVSGNVPLYRSASKVRLEVTIPESLYDAGNPADYANYPDRRVKDGNGFTWIPQPEGMKAVLVHGVKKGIICAMDESYSYNIASTDYFAEASSTDLIDVYGHAMHLTKTNETSGAVVSKSYEHKVPMYSYPTSDWKGNANNETHMMLVLPWARLNDDGTINVVKNTYYQIPISVNPTDPTYQLKHNRYYRMEVTVGILGSFELEDKVNLYPSTYVILDWSTMNDESTQSVSNVNMAQTSYLAVATHRDTLNNVTSHGVEYASSHDVTVTVTKIEYLNYKNKIVRMARITPSQPNRIYYYTQNSTTGEWDVYNSYETSTGIYASYVANATTKEGYITLTHTIPSSQYTPVNVYVTVSNGVVQDEEIIFTQYPPISIEGNLSNGYVFVKEYSNSSEVNNIYTDNGEWIGKLNERTGAASLTATGTNTNPMLYSIKISSFSPTDDYILGDPRVSTPSTVAPNWYGSIAYYYNQAEAASHGSYTTETGTFYFSYSEWQANQSIITREDETTSNSYSNFTNNWYLYNSEANAYGPDSNGYYYWRTGSGGWGGGNYTYHRRRYSYTGTRYVVSSGLTNYYPTSTGGTSMMIAPEILIASSYGKTTYSEMTLDRAVMRCALYQEDGYPAGRWRLPTFAEVKFIMGLSTNNTIPTLFQMDKPDYVGYWCANGKVVANNSGQILLETPGNYTNSSNTAPRCVYDLWYWGDEHELYATTWHLGDND